MGMPLRLNYGGYTPNGSLFILFGPENSNMKTLLNKFYETKGESVPHILKSILKK